MVFWFHFLVELKCWTMFSLYIAVPIIVYFLKHFSRKTKFDFRQVEHENIRFSTLVCGKFSELFLFINAAW
jgi:hypothetical protein